MLALDTNIVVRFLTKDDPEQARQARRILKAEDCFICDSVILETGWVLESVYGFTKKEVDRGLRLVVGLANVQVEDPLRLRRALDWYVAGMDLADAIHLSHCQQFSELITFDRSFIEKAAGKGTCAVLNPKELLSES